jgi:membrane protease YdiL (CAAX protease family)
VFLPRIVTADATSTVLLGGIAAGLTTLLEEIGWTGFVIPRLRLRHGILSAGLIVGVLWGAWHFLQQLWIADTLSGGLPVALFLPLSFLGSALAQLTAYRVLMVWVYDRTGSLLVAWLMHASLSANLIFIFAPQATGAAGLIYAWVLAAALWAVVATVAVASRGLWPRPLRPQVA